jgi:hypothetical protein
MLYWICVTALLFNVNREFKPNLIDKGHGSNPDLRGVDRVIICKTNASLNQLAQESSLWKLLGVFDTQKAKEVAHCVEVLNHVRVEPLHDAHVHPSHLVSAVGEVADAIHELFGKVLMSLQGIVDCVDAVVFALEPLRYQVHQLDVTVKILGDA